MQKLIPFSHYENFIYNFKEYTIAKQNIEYNGYELICCLTIGGVEAHFHTEYYG